MSIKSGDDLKVVSKSGMHTKILTIVVVVVIVVIIIMIIAAAANSSADSQSSSGSSSRRGRGRRVIKRVTRERSRSYSGHREYKKSGCDGKQDRPHPPRDVCCSSEEKFSVDVKWNPAACEVDHYRIYVKYLKHIEDDDANNFLAECGKPECQKKKKSKGIYIKCESSESSESSESCEKCECGPHNYDKIVTVPGCDTSVRIADLRKKAVCVTVSAVSKCGRESGTANCCQSWIKGKCRIYPCIVKSTCEKLNLRWGPVNCAKCIRVYYDGELMYELPGDAEGIKRLPSIDGKTTKVTVTTENEASVESKHYEANKACPCKGSDCGERECRKKKKCFKCEKPEDSCKCKGKRTKTRHHSESSDSSSSSSSSGSSDSHSGRRD